MDFGGKQIISFFYKEQQQLVIQSFKFLTMKGFVICMKNEIRITSITLIRTL